MVMEGGTELEAEAEVGELEGPVRMRVCVCMNVCVKMFICQ